MKKGVFALLLVALLIIPIFSLVLVHAQGYQDMIDAGVDSATAAATDPTGASTPTTATRGVTTTVGGSSNFFESFGTFFTDKMDFWLHPEKNKDTEKTGAFLKYLFLLLVIMLVYSSLSYADFPKGTSVKIITAIIVGFLATFAITTKELLTVVQSYTALGMTLSIFFPIMILGFFTMVVATKGAPTGIFLQRIVWLIYSVYLFFKRLVVFIISQSTASGTGLVLPGWAILFKPLVDQFVATFKDTTELTNFISSNYDTTTTYLLLLVSIAVFVICVLSNKMVVAWLAKEQNESAIEARKRDVELSRARDKINAEDMRKG
jgi:hypothetical protein